jgi:hypothetical protein
MIVAGIIIVVMAWRRAPAMPALTPDNSPPSSKA